MKTFSFERNSTCTVNNNFQFQKIKNIHMSRNSGNRIYGNGTSVLLSKYKYLNSISSTAKEITIKKELLNDTSVFKSQDCHLE